MADVDARPDDRPPDSRLADSQPPDDRSPDDRSPDDRPRDDRPRDDRPPDDRPPDDRPPGDGRHSRPDQPEETPTVSVGEVAISPQTGHAFVSAVTPGLVFRWAVAATAGVFVVLVVSSALYAVRDILVLMLIAMFIAVSLDPAVRWMIRHGVRRSVAVTLIISTVLILTVAFFVSVVPPLVTQAGKLTSELPGFIQQLPQRFRSYKEFSDRFNLTDRLTALAASVPEKVGTSTLAFARRFLGALISTVTVIVLAIYFMADLPRLRRGLVRLFPRSHRPRVAEIANVVVDKVGGYMIGNLIISVFAGVTTFVALAALRVPYALPLAVLMAIADLIPLVGATIGAAVCALVALFTRGLWPVTIIAVAFFILYQQAENYLIAPRVLRNTVNMSSVAVLLAALIGGTALGLVGALMAIPIVAAVKVLLSPTIAAMNEPAEGEPPVPVDADG
jgi:predicted PurR-regulated permease PerM